MASIFASGIDCAGPTRGSAISRVLMLGCAAALLGGAMPVADLEVDVGSLRSSKGQLRFCLTADATSFPDCSNGARALARSVAAGQGRVRFDALPRGQWAIAVIHDANGNGKLDTFAGIPREGFGFSNNPPIRFGAPSFVESRFRVEGAASAQQVKMRYLL